MPRILESWLSAGAHVDWPTFDLLGIWLTLQSLGTEGVGKSIAEMGILPFRHAVSQFIAAIVSQLTCIPVEYDGILD